MRESEKGESEGCMSERCERGPKVCAIKGEWGCEKGECTKKINLWNALEVPTIKYLPRKINDRFG